MRRPRHPHPVTHLRISPSEDPQDVSAPRAGLSQGTSNPLQCPELGLAESVLFSDLWWSKGGRAGGQLESHLPFPG